MGKAVIAIHGGAGAITRSQLSQEQELRYIQALSDIVETGQRMLEDGRSALDVVTEAVRLLEECPLFNAGIGATCTAEGTFELDASIMEGKDLSAGAVAGLKHVKHPINAAYAVKAKSPHVMLSGAGAEEVAKEQGLEMVEDNMYFATPKTMGWIEKLKQESKKNGTVGCVVLDKQGNLTAGTSTGGMFKKRWGRIGDSPVIGAGTYADNNSCAVSCTGHGEYFIRHAVAFDVCARYKYLKESVEKAADYIIHTELNANGDDPPLEQGLAGESFFKVYGIVHLFYAPFPAQRRFYALSLRQSAVCCQ